LRHLPPAHFSLPLSRGRCSCFQDDDDGSDYDYDDEDLLDYIVDRLKNSRTDYLMPGPLGSDIRKNANLSDALDRARGLKDFCLDHDDEIEWIDDGGGGTIYLVKSGSFPVGSNVCIRAEKPTFGWGLARSWSVGTVRSFRGGQYIVDFPEVKGWKCKENDLAISPGLYRI
jgi:hypothetical protein